LQVTDQIPAINNAIGVIGAGLPALVPEIALSLGFVLLLVLDILPKVDLTHLRIMTLVVCAVVALFCLERLSGAESSYFFDGVVINPLAGLWQLVFLAAIALTTIMDMQLPHSEPSREKSALLLSLGLGAFLMVLSRHYLIMLIGIELVSMSSYVLVAMNGKKLGYEAGIKYLLFGAMATAIMLYGISLIYGLTGSLSFVVFPTENAILVVMAIMVLIGILFKLGAAPMHIWTPDVYQATPTSTVALFSVVPKLAGIGLLLNWLQSTGLWQNELIQYTLALVAMLSIIIGVLSAIWQQNVKRLMAYSTIANAGFLLLGIIPGTELGISAVVFYAIIYFFMNYLTFYLLAAWEAQGWVELKSFSGRGGQSYYAAILIVIAMISLTGLPPTAGFTGKLLLFSSLWSGLDQPVIQVLFSVALLSTVVSLFFYLKIPYQMFFKTQNEDPSATSNGHLPKTSKWLVTFLALPLLWLFIKSDFLLNFIQLHIFAP
jgi:NADH-quinone oxidoreductase subunit N